MTTEPSTELPMETEHEPEESSSIFGRMFNVYAAPGELFEEVRDAKPAHSNWLVPVALSILVGIVFSVAVFSQPDIVASVFAPQEEAIMAKVEAGDLTQDQADQQLNAMRQFQSGKLMMMFGIFGSVIGTGIFLVVIAALIWLLAGKILKGNVTYFKAIEVVGLAGMVNVVGGIVTLMIVLLKANIAAGPNPTLLLGNFDPANYAHQILAALNVITIWYLAVLAIAVSKLAKRPFGTAALWVFGFWALIRFPIAAVSAWWTQFQSNM